MSFEQQVFLGCSVLSFDGSVGWGNQLSTLKVSLVEDTRKGQELARIDIGFPHRFQFGDWTFDGILNEVSPKRSVSGNRIIDVTLVSPTEILKGVQLITNGFTQDVDVTNIYNIYGYLENLNGYGSSNVNDSGMEWRKIYDSTLTMINNNPIKFKGYSYFIDMTRLPVLPEYYRVPNKTLSLLDFIEDVCETGSYDYFIELSGNVIVVRTLDRRSQPALGRITQFIEEQTAAGVNVSSSNIGLENEYNVSNRVIVGPPKEEVHFQFYNNFDVSSDEEKEVGIDYLNNETFADDMISQYWGLDANGNAIVQRLVDGKISFLLDGYPISVPGKITIKTARRQTTVTNVSKEWELDFRAGYPSDEEEIMAAMVSQESWETYLILNNVEGTKHYKKADYLGINSNLRKDTAAFIKGLAKGQLEVLTPNKIFNFNKRYDRKEETLRHVYQYIKSIGDNYYGRKYMVRIPDIASKIDSGTNKTITSLEVTDSGYLQDQEISYGINNGLLPADIDFLYTEDGKINSFARGGFIHEKTSNVYFDRVYGNFYKVDIDPQIIYLNKRTGFGPRVVINCPIFISNGQGENSILTSSPLYQLLLTRARDVNITGPEDFVAQFFRTAGAEGMKFPSEGYSGYPDLVGVTLKNNINNYGPWKSLGGTGKASIEIDDNMAPWVFGGYEALNQAGNALVSQAYSERFTGESGSLEVVGSPSIRLGTQLIYAGPYVTDINVTVDGNNGVTTSYRMNRWSTNSDKLLRYNLEKFKDLNRLKRESDREKRNFIKGRTQGNYYREIGYKKSLQGNSSSNMLMGTTKFSEDFSVQNTTVVASPNYNAVDGIGDDNTYRYSAGVSMDGLFRPFSTNKNETRLPHLEIEPDGSTPTASSLNPYKDGNDIEMFLHGEQIPDDIRESIDYNNIRALGIRSPIILVGYGLDTNGKPVPNEDPDNPTDNFHPDYLTDQSLWKAGPLDSRWDDVEKVWIATGKDIKKIFIPDNIVSESGTGLLDGSTVNIYNVSLGSGTNNNAHAIPKDTYILAANIGGEVGGESDSWVPIQREYFAKNIVYQYTDGVRTLTSFSTDGITPPTGIIQLANLSFAPDNGYLTFNYDYTNTNTGMVVYSAEPSAYTTVLTDVSLHPTSGIVFQTKNIAVRYQSDTPITVATMECL